MHAVLAKSALLKRFAEDEKQGQNNSSTATGGNFAIGGAASVKNNGTHVERKEELKLLISFEDSKWICATLWKHFFTTVASSNNN